MTTALSNPHASPSRALILLFDQSSSPLWDRKIHGLLEAVEQRLEQAPVTFAVARGSGPSLGDALAAVRFAGCESAAVVAAPDLDLATLTARPRSASTAPPLPFEVLRCAWDAGSIADRFCHRGGGDAAQAA